MVIKNADPVAMLTTDRSIPPVSITMVCPAARMPRGAANRSVFDSQTGFTVPGFTISTIAMKARRSRMSAAIVLRRNQMSALRASKRERGAEAFGELLICGSSAR